MVLFLCTWYISRISIFKVTSLDVVSEVLVRSLKSFVPTSRKHSLVSGHEAILICGTEQNRCFLCFDLTNAFTRPFLACTFSCDCIICCCELLVWFETWANMEIGSLSFSSTSSLLTSINFTIILHGSSLMTQKCCRMLSHDKVSPFEFNHIFLTLVMSLEFSWLSKTTLDSSLKLQICHV